MFITLFGRFAFRRLPFGKATVIGFIRSGWPDFESKVPEVVKDFYKVRGELSEVEGLVTRGQHHSHSNERSHTKNNS